MKRIYTLAVMMVIVIMAAAQTENRWYNINVAGKSPVKIEVAGSDKVTIDKVQTYDGESQIVVKKNGTTIGTYLAKNTTITSGSEVVAPPEWENKYGIDTTLTSKYGGAIYDDAGFICLFIVYKDKGIQLSYPEYQGINKLTDWSKILRTNWDELAENNPCRLFYYGPLDMLAVIYENANQFLFKQIDGWGNGLADKGAWNYNNNTPYITSKFVKNINGTLSLFYMNKEAVFSNYGTYPIIKTVN